MSAHFLSSNFAILATAVRPDISADEFRLGFYRELFTGGYFFRKKTGQNIFIKKITGRKSK